MEDLEMKQNTGEINKIIAGILRLGSVVSIVFMAAGLVLFLAAGGSLPEVSVIGFRQALAGVPAFDPVALMTLGIVVLLFTPVFRVAGALFSFLLLEKDLTYALISLGVLLILATSLFIPGFK